MPTIPIQPLEKDRTLTSTDPAIPQILQTPSGLAILEIQGTIKFSSPPTGTTSSPVGKLIFPYYNEGTSADDTSWHKRVHLYVGKHQRLTGEVKKLAKPIAVLRRRATVDDADELEIAEIVYYKLLFQHRPEPVGGEN